MIYYDQWLSQDVKFNAAQTRHNEVSAANIYATLRPLRLVSQAIGARVGELWETWRANRRWASGVRELSGLDDHLLNDIGLTRGQITELARSSMVGDVEHRLALRGGRPLLGWTKRKQPPSCDIIPLRPIRQARAVGESKGATPRHPRSLDAA